MEYPIAENAVQAPGIRKIPLAVYAMLVLTIIGIADAAYVAHGNYAGAQLWCPILDGCNTVVNSPYSRVFGTPMSYFGFIYYLFMFGLAARLAYEPFSRSLRFRAILYAGLGAISSIYFLYLQLGYIREVCSYCLISAVTSFLLLFATLWHFQATRQAA
jgi:Vitamin K epoxide reductase family